MLPLHISAPETFSIVLSFNSWFDLFLSSHRCLMQTITWRAFIRRFSPHPFPFLPPGFVTLTTSRGSAGAQCWALSLTVIINNLELQKWATRLSDTLSGLKRSDALSPQVAWIYPLLCFGKTLRKAAVFRKHPLGHLVPISKTTEGIQPMRFSPSRDAILAYFSVLGLTIMHVLSSSRVWHWCCHCHDALKLCPWAPRWPM